MFPIYFFLSTLISCGICDTNYRLNTKVIPSEYEITITPYFNTSDKRAFTFDGNVRIKVSTPIPGISQIKLHSENLTFTSHNVTVRTKNGIVPLSKTNPLQYNDKYTFVYINLGVSLLANYEYTVNIIYTGPIRNDLYGFYRASYVENGNTKWYGVTQMGLTHARKVFPCFDEPQLKSKFTFIIDRPKNYSPSLANTKLQSTTVLNNGYVRERFFPTPLLSTYLVSFLISEFSNGGHIVRGDRDFGVWVRPTATNQSEYAFNFGKRVVAELGKYFGIDYYSVNRNLHLYHVGIAKFVWVAMEDWGLIKYKEEFLMYDPSESTAQTKFDVAQTIAHETTHMWFGNLVTCHWWSDAWLNEGFATYFQDYITSFIEPQLGSAYDQVTYSTYTAYNADEYEKSVPLTNNNVNSPTEIEAQFGSISYEKGSSIIRMIHHWIGDEAFKRGLHQYLISRRLRTVTPSMLYTALDTSVMSTKSLAAYPGYTVARLLTPWVTQAGHPMLNVNLDRASGKITLTQNRFYANSSFHSNEIYPIPITYTTQSAVNFNNTKPAFIMSDKTYSFGNFSKAGWVIFNLQETGFYRVNYDDYLWSLIATALRGNSRTAIHVLNRAKIVNDLFALILTKQITLKQLSDRLEFLAEETEFSVWRPAVNGFFNLRDITYGTNEDKELVIFIKRLLIKVVQKLGFDEKASDTFETKRNRMQIARLACDVEYQSCVDHAVSLFKAFRNKGTPISPSLRPVVYCQGLKHGTTQDYNVMSTRLNTTNVASEARVIENALNCAPKK